MTTDDQAKAGAEHFAALVKTMLDDARATDQKLLADAAQAISSFTLRVDRIVKSIDDGFKAQAEAHGQLMGHVARLDTKMAKMEASMVSLGTRMERVEAEMKLVRIEEQGTRQQVMLVRGDQERLGEQVNRLEDRVSAIEAKLEV